MALINVHGAAALADMLENKYIGGTQNLSANISAQAYTTSIEIQGNNVTALAGVGSHSTITLPSGCYAHVSDDLETWTPVTSGGSIAGKKFVFMQNRGTSNATVTFA